MLQDVINRVNQARQRAQQSSHFQHSAQQHAEAIKSQEMPPSITTKRKHKAKNKSLADVYKPYFEADTQH